MHKIVPKGQKRPSTWPKGSLCNQMGPKGLYLIGIIYIIYISVIESLLSLYCMHKPPKGTRAQTHGPKPLCVIRRAPKAFYLICIIVTGGEGYLSHDF